MERLNGMTLALGQAWAKQKLQGEEILQLVERGVPVWSLLSGLMANMSDEWLKFKGLVADAGWQDYVKSLLKDFSVSIQELTDNGTLTQEEYTEVLERVKRKLQEIRNEADLLGGEIGGLNDGIGDNEEKLQSFGSGLAGVFNQTTAELHALSAQAEDAFLAMQGATNIDTTAT